MKTPTVNNLTADLVVLLPAFNEAATICQTIEAFKAVLPTSQIIVGDNNSTDNTSFLAKEAGAICLMESRPGKGFCVKTLFEYAPDADVYILCDADNTYGLENLNSSIQKLLAENYDFAIGRRVYSTPDSERKGHQSGNKLFRFLTGLITQQDIKDPFSGFRLMTREYVQSINVTSKGFEIETELNLHGVFLGFNFFEFDSSYSSRPEGSHSKLRTLRDGFRILAKLGNWYRVFFPKRVGLAISGFFIVAGSVLLLRVVEEFLRTGLVTYIPSAIFGIGSVLVGFAFLNTFIVLSAIARVNRDLSRYHAKSISYLRKH
tara:strand:- start:440 stop:1393 length:954 start_codon:yes stop_codon:yes gene_type:complete